MADPQTYSGQIVEVRATPRYGFESSRLTDSSGEQCASPWFNWASEEGTTVRKPDIEQKTHPVFLKKDADLEAFQAALDAQVYPRQQNIYTIGGLSRYTVTATFTGRIDYAGENGWGYGHMNGSRVRFVMISVRDVSTVENTYNWKEFSREPVRFPHGTINGKLMDADGRPISKAWVGAIPPSGQTFPFKKVLTEKDGSYTLDVNPGDYFVVANYDTPATNDVPIPITFFPSTEHEENAKLVHAPDYADLKDIDIQAPRKLIPRYFEVQVLMADGSLAIGAYAFLTQVDQPGIAGSASGVSHTYANGHVRLMGFEGIDYLLWADLGSWPSKRCAHVTKLLKDQPYADVITVKIEAANDVCSKEEEHARTIAYSKHR